MINTCFDTMPIEGIYYDLETYIPANGRYELENCLPHNLRIINEYKNGIPDGVEEYYYAINKTNVDIQRSPEWLPINHPSVAWYVLYICNYTDRIEKRLNDE